MTGKIDPNVTALYHACKNGVFATAKELIE